MRLFLFLLCLIASLGVSAQEASPDQPLGFTLPEMPLPAALARIEQATTWRFSYNPRLLPATHRVALRDARQSLRTTLDEWLRGTGLGYRVIGGQVGVFRVEGAEENTLQGLERFSPGGTPVIVSGYLRDARSGEALVGGSVFTHEGRGILSNRAGFFSLKVPGGPLRLYARYVGYLSDTLWLNLTQDTLLAWALQPSLALDSVRITARRVNDDRMGAIRLNVEQLKELPALGGEPDVIKAVQLLPGVKFGNEGTSGLFVRGGTPDQNLILLDGVPIYNASHLFGFTSIFHPYGLKQVELYKGGFPARYGGRLSSVLDIQSREGSRESFQGQARLGIVSSNLMVEGPLAGGKASYLVSARRSLYELFTLPIQWWQRSLPDGNYAHYHFGDINARLSYRPNQHDEWTFATYQGQDRLSLVDFIEVDTLLSKQQNGVRWGNRIAALGWNHLWGPRLFSQFTGYYNRYRLGVSASSEETLRLSGTNDWTEQAEVRYRSGIEDWGAKWDFAFSPNPKHQVKFGAQGVFHRFLPGAVETAFQVNGVPDSSLTRPAVEPLPALEGRLYLEDNFQFSPAWQFNAGLHASAFRVEERTYALLEPRLLLQWRPAENLTVSAAYSRMQQYLHLLSNSGLGLPIDLWVPPTQNIPPQQAWQSSLGLAWQVTKGFYLTLDGYYKEMNGLIDYREGSSFLLEGNEWTEQVEIEGEGRSYGVELLLRKDLGRWRGWLGYTWAKTDRQFDAINQGRRYPFRYDRRHEVSLVLRYALTDRWELNFNWVYATGNAFTMPQAVFASNLYPEQTGFIRFRSRNSFVELFDPTRYVGRTGRRQEVEIFDYGDRNSSRMPDYHRLDLGLSWRKPNPKGERIWRFSLYNAYNRVNPYYIRYGQAGVPGEDFRVVQGRFEKVGLLPILPALSYQFNF